MGHMRLRTFGPMIAAALLGVATPRLLRAFVGSTIVHETILLKEGWTREYPMRMSSPGRVELEIGARPAAVNVMLMSDADWKTYNEAASNIFGGTYTLRTAPFSKEDVLHMKETATLPSGSWHIVVKRPRESLLFGDDTAVTVSIRTY